MTEIKLSTEEQRLKTALAAAKEKAQYVVRDPVWDAIFDAQALLEGRPTIMQGSREELMTGLTRVLERFNTSWMH